MIWRHIPGFEGNYLVSDVGQVWSIRRGICLKPKIDRYGYEVVTLSIKGKAYSRTVHRLVAQAFLPNPNNLATVNHINENKVDNRVENLEWMSVADNDNYGSRNKKMANTKCRLPVEQILPNGITIKYKGVKDASRKTGINRSSIAICCQHKRKTAGGYRWRYINENNSVVC